MSYDLTFFDGRWQSLPERPYRRPAHPGHSRECSSDPEIGCVCGGAEIEAERDAPCQHPDFRLRRNEDGSETCRTCGTRARWGFRP